MVHDNGKGSPPHEDSTSMELLLLLQRLLIGIIYSQSPKEAEERGKVFVVEKLLCGDAPVCMHVISFTKSLHLQ